MFSFFKQPRRVALNSGVPHLSVPQDAKRSFKTRPVKMLDLKEIDYTALIRAGGKFAILVKMGGTPKFILPVNRTDCLTWTVNGWFSGYAGRRAKISVSRFRMVDSYGKIIKVGVDSNERILLYKP